jgi:hypothetical protein
MLPFSSCVMSFDKCIYPWNRHHSQDIRHFHYPPKSLGPLCICTSPICFLTLQTDFKCSRSSHKWICMVYTLFVSGFFCSAHFWNTPTWLHTFVVHFFFLLNGIHCMATLLRVYLLPVSGLFCVWCVHSFAKAAISSIL